MFGNRTCGDIGSHLWNYAAGRISEEDVERIEDHLRGCSSCREQADDYGKAVAGLAAFREHSTPQARTNWADLQARLTTDGRRRSPIGFGRLFPTLAWGGLSVALCAGLLMVVFHPFSKPLIDFSPAPPTPSIGAPGISVVSPPGDDHVAMTDEAAGNFGPDYTDTASRQAVKRPYAQTASYRHRPRYTGARRPSGSSFQASARDQHSETVPASLSSVDGEPPAVRTVSENYVLSPVGFGSGQDDTPDYVMGSVPSSRRSDATASDDGRGW